MAKFKILGSIKNQKGGSRFVVRYDSHEQIAPGDTFRVFDNEHSIDIKVISISPIGDLHALDVDFQIPYEGFSERTVIDTKNPDYALSHKSEPDDKAYKAIIWMNDSSPGKRVMTYAKNLHEANVNLEALYGAGKVYDLHNEIEANGPRNPTKELPYEKPNFDILANIELYPASRGGRKKPIGGRYFGCPSQIGHEYFDCRIYLQEKVLAAGESLQGVPVKFLFPELVKPLLTAGATLELWESGNFGKLTVTKILF